MPMLLPVPCCVVSCGSAAGAMGGSASTAAGSEEAAGDEEEEEAESAGEVSGVACAYSMSTCLGHVRAASATMAACVTRVPVRPESRVRKGLIRESSSLTRRGGSQKRSTSRRQLVWRIQTSSQLAHPDSKEGEKQVSQEKVKGVRERCWACLRAERDGLEGMLRRRRI